MTRKERTFWLGFIHSHVQQVFIKLPVYTVYMRHLCQERFLWRRWYLRLALKYA